MSNINIKRAVENIRGNTTAYTPVVELIVNAIQAIEESGRDDGKVSIQVLRTPQAELDDSLPDIVGFEIEDNGIGFTDEHRDSFDTLYTDHRIAQGGKGFGRFICLKYFRDLHISSVYRQGSEFKSRRFSMGKDHDIIVNEEVASNGGPDTQTIARLIRPKKQLSLDKTLSIVARQLVERLLPYFIIQDWVCPIVLISEQDRSDRICLNEFTRNEVSLFIQELHVDDNSFTIDDAVQIPRTFHVRVFKIYSPKTQKSRISLVAHKRDVSGSALHKYVPEFVDDFYEEVGDDENGRQRNYIIKVYVFGSYLDDHVSLERSGFDFSMDSDLLLGISQSDIEERAAMIARVTVGSDIELRITRKKKRVQTYVDTEAPWYKSVIGQTDLRAIPYNPTDEDIETHLQRARLAQEHAIKRDVADLLSKGDLHNLREDVVAIAGRVSESSKEELIRYIALRRKILDIFARSLETDDSGNYSSEGVVHDIVFPRRGDTENTSFDDHNLWIIDERLNFTNYISSDIPIGGGHTGRPDLLVYDRRVLFRGDNEPSNPITIFEFKRPQREDFVYSSSDDDPVQQIIRYVNEIRDGKHRTPQGRDIVVAENTPFYGFVVCDITRKIALWLEREKNFSPMPDRSGWFQWLGNINLYIEVVSWPKVLKDARMRNRIFFEKLGIQ